jgi:hypothetical protein
MKTNLHGTFATNKKTEEEGVELEIKPKDQPEDKEGVVFKIRRFSPLNPRVQAAMAAHHKPYARQLEMGLLSPSKSLELNILIFLDISLVGWRNILDESGKEIPYSRENALKLFKDLPDLFEFVHKYAMDADNFKDDVGNS